MSTSKPSPNLNELIARAEGSVHEQKRKRVPNAPRATWITWKSAPVAICVAVFFWIWLLSQSAVSASKIVDDLENLLLTARSNIDNQTREYGHLPEHLSDVTLARVVHYEITDPNARPPRYRLVAEIAGVKRVWPTND